MEVASGESDVFEVKADEESAVSIEVHMIEWFTLSFAASEAPDHRLEKMGSLQVNAGTPTKLPPCTYTAPTGKMFGGWKLSADAEEIAYEDEGIVRITEDLMLYPHWVERNFVLINYANYDEATDKTAGGEALNNIIMKGQTFALPVLIRDGYFFAGWFSSADFSGSEIFEVTAMDSDITVYAKWIKYVTLKAGGDWTRSDDMSSPPKYSIKEYVFQNEPYTGSYGWTWDGGVTSGEITVYAVSLESFHRIIVSGNGNLLRANPDCSYMFGIGEPGDYTTPLDSITGLNLLDTSKVTNMKGMFMHSNELTSLDLSGFDTSKVTDMSDMFSYCTSLATIYVNPDLFKTNQVLDSTDMFYGANALTGGSEPFDKTKAHTGAGGFFKVKP